VEISVAPDDLNRLVDDTDKVYAEIFKAVPGFVYGTLGVRGEDQRLVAVVYFESAEALHSAESLIEGIREAVRVSPGATFTLTDYEVLLHRQGLESSKLFAAGGETAAPGAPA
jgi:hypothetical protein